MPTKRLSACRGEFVQLGGQPLGQELALFFVCPVCADGHGILVQWQGRSIYPSGVIWTRTGTTLDDVSFTPSINCDVPDAVTGQASTCTFHGWVTAGDVRW